MCAGAERATSGASCARYLRLRGRGRARLGVSPGFAPSQCGDFRDHSCRAGVRPARGKQPKLNREKLDQILQPLQVLSFDDTAAGRVPRRARLEARGEMIGPLDMPLAAQALALELTLVTNNVREFERVEGLQTEDWTTE